MRKDVFEGVFMAKKENLKINYSEIAKQYNCDPRTVKRYFEERENNPTIRKPRKIVKVTDGFEKIIEEKYVNYKAPAIAIFNLLKDKYNYKGSYTSIKRFTRNLKEERISEATLRFETNPGQQCQIDWKESLKLMNKNGEVYVINIFLAILGFSRKKYIELTLDKTQPTLFKCLTNMFRSFGGVPKELLFDNMKTVVDRSRTQFNKAQYNEKLYAFSKDANFEPKSCIAFRPRTKGKVETVAKIMNRLKVLNGEFSTIEELDSCVKNLMDEINNEIQQTTKEKPNDRFTKEKEYLRAEPNYSILEAYYSTKPMTRKVPKDALITFQTKRYSVPVNYIGKTVTIQCEGDKLFIYHNNSFVCSHQISNKNISYIPEHYAEMAKLTFKDEELIKTICENNLDILDKI